MTQQAQTQPLGPGEPTTHACLDCEVTWGDASSACWSCGAPGLSTPEAVASLSTAPLASSMTTAPAPTGPGVLTRWGSNPRLRAALGLPDPRAPRTG